MNFTDLRSFLAVAESASFSIAAQHLHVTQPAVSKRIQALEANFAVKLFDRVGKRVYLTQAGKVLVLQAKQMLALLSDTEKQLQNLAQHITGTLNLATSHHIGLHRLAPVLAAFRKRYPDVQLNVSFEDSEVAHDMLHHGDIELAIVTLNPLGDESLHYEEIWHDPLVFVSATTLGRKDHQDESIASQITLQELATLPCVLPGTGTYTGRIVLQRFAEQGLTLTPSMSTNYLETISMLVSVGLGWSVLPRSMLGALEQVPVNCTPMFRTLGCVTNPARVASNAASAFTAVLKEFSAPLGD